MQTSVVIFSFFFFWFLCVISSLLQGGLAVTHSHSVI